MQTLVKLRHRFWYQTPVSETDRPILGAVVGDRMTLMIDSGNSKAHAQLFLSELEKQGIPSPRMVVLTHWHWDHIFGLSALDIPSIASRLTKAEIEKLIPFLWTDDALDERVESGVEIEFCASAIKKEYGNDRRIKIKLPDITFEKKLEIDLGGVTCQLQQVGGDHSPDSVVVYIKEEKILFLGDAIYANLYASKWNYTASRVLQLMDALDQFDADTYILSHGTAISKAEYQEEAAMLRMAARLTEEFEGQMEEMKNAYKSYVNRELNDNEQETMQYFVNGYELQKTSAV
ncbi:glyoxylase-like metal-dependent hydrolase (beta-lactamase superfamily II) [Cytobacillus firmus]|uniref:Glyoxylase-like metal-dependent hydrolase (Beta-lactamase superfamily II) n=2 Tax=Cytobacillus TaxID=2675230 RepID=A0A366JS82_CYTFI|nr:MULTISPECIES: MBL fold metallo-hydrolase [Cytobacillus]RBP90630.1 glyoxylase-like metal-dependent hydrolase (beta-lactamase superfamily II) [Cytobacillus firmus]TDX46212.1 glyoxylase-like metal-dependent hydrolase (beta-lactamase superfamily II) [Cytobacillus oceanisediminis]